MSVLTDLRLRAQRDAAVRTIRARLVGCRFELEQALAESGEYHLTGLGLTLDRALLDVERALKSDALSGK